MVTWLSKKHIRYDNQGRDVVLAYIAVASVSELPTKYGIDGYALAEASKAWDVSTGKTYGFIDGSVDGSWHEQTTVINPMVIKGRVNTVNDLPSNAEVGWVYLVGLATDTEFKEYLYTADNRWEFIGYNALVIDSTLSNESENPVQNKVITAALGGKVNTSDVESAVTSASTNPVSGGAVFTSLTAITEQAYEQIQTKTQPLYFIYEE